MNFFDEIKKAIENTVPRFERQTDPLEQEEIVKIHTELRSDIVMPPMPELPPVDPIAYRYKERTDRRKILNTVWNSQRDNKYSPASACNVTAVQSSGSMDWALKDDELWELCHSKQTIEAVRKKYPKDFGWISPFFKNKCANEVFAVLAEAVNVYLQSDKFCKYVGNISQGLIISEIDKGYAVNACGAWAGSGHFVSICGYDLDKKCWIVNDPWGDWNTKYTDRNGNNKEYLWAKNPIGSFIRQLGILLHADKRIEIK